MGVARGDCNEGAGEMGAVMKSEGEVGDANEVGEVGNVEQGGGRRKEEGS
jgi:hypothetical protein